MKTIPECVDIKDNIIDIFDSLSIEQRNKMLGEIVSYYLTINYLNKMK